MSHVIIVSTKKKEKKKVKNDDYSIDYASCHKFDSTPFCALVVRGQLIESRTRNDAINTHLLYYHDSIGIHYSER